MGSFTVNVVIKSQKEAKIEKIFCGVRKSEQYVRTGILSGNGKGVSYLLSNVSCDHFNEVKLKASSDITIGKSDKMLAVDWNKLRCDAPQLMK